MKPISRRKLGLHHIAFFRGYLDGVPLSALSERYLYLEPGAGCDEDRAKVILRWIRDELIRAARKARPDYARLLRIPLERIPSPPLGSGTEEMDLETFRVDRDPEGFYTEKELIELFEEAYGSHDPQASRRAVQGARLRQKIRDAIAWLESWAAEEPKFADPINAWLDEGLAVRLAVAGADTLGDLVTLIRKRGKHWHRKVAKLGQTGARRLESWLKDRGILTVEPVVMTKKTAPTLPSVMEVVPLDRLDLPITLSGVSGENRAYGTALAARNDREAIEEWLSSLGPKVHTVRSYRKEAERFLLWCIFERGIPMSSAKVEDCTAYRNFLSDIGRKDDLWFWSTPQDRWVGARNQPRWSEDWKPFSGALALTSQRQSVTILTIMFEYLRRQRYLETNPWDGVSPILTSAPAIRKDHSLTPEQWRAVMQALEDIENKGEAFLRLRFCLILGYTTGLRLDEMARAIVAKHSVKPGESNPGLKPAEDGDGWDLEVIGKGLKARSVPMAEVTMSALSAYMEVRGYGGDPGQWPPETPLLVTLPHGMQYVKQQREPMSWTAIYRMLKAHFKRAAHNMPAARDAGHLMQASTHWLRHTHATHAISRGAAIQDVQEILGHASMATTSIYSHASRKRRKAAVELLQN